MYQSTEKKILVPDQMSYAKPIEGLAKITGDTQEFYSRPADFAMVLFTGGADVSPELYNDSSPLGLCHTNKARDRTEMKLFAHAKQHSIKMVGICRGIQFLNVMSGGTLIHDITGHNTTRTHTLRIANEEWGVIKVNSLHHQMMIPPPNGYIIADALYRLSNHYLGYEDQPVKWPGREVEAVLIPETKCVGVQYHPEMMTKGEPGYNFFREMVKHFLEMDLHYFTKQYTGAKEVGHVK